MRHLNYTHLLYFWTVAREGSIARAAEILHLTPQTISGQLKQLEQSVDAPLFERVGRGLALTDTGKVVNQYADEIFQLGAELTQRVKSRQTLIPTTLNVGIVNAVPKLVAMHMLKPALELDTPIKIACTEGDLDMLLGDLGVHRLDLVISDRPLPAGSGIKAFSHRLGESSLSFFAHTRIARSYRNFPDALHQAPMLMPATNTPLRRLLDEWFDECGIVPRIIAEFDDSALLKAFGADGLGVFPAPTVLRSQVSSVYHSRHLGTVKGIREEFFAISAERRLKHPAVVAITKHARDVLVPQSD